MAVAAPRSRKNDSATETARVMRVFDMLAEEMATRFRSQPFLALWDGSSGAFIHNSIPQFLEIADRIAARTEER